MRTRSPWHHEDRRARRADQPVIELNPHALHILSSNPALLDLIVDCGRDEPLHRIRLPRDLALILNHRLTEKLGAST